MKSTLMTRKPVITEEDRKIIQYSQLVTWAVTKPAKQAVESLLKAPLLGGRHY